METKKQTVVEWLKDRLEDFGDPQVCEIEWKDLDLLLERAKQMEKEKIIEAYKNGVNILIYSKEQMYKKSEQYYNETFNK